MYIGTQKEPRDDADFAMLAQFGIRHICLDPPGNWRGWSLDALKAHRADVERRGLVLDMIQLPLPSVPVDRAPCADILLGGPERDAQIAAVCKLIEDCGAAGIPAAKYNFNYIGIPRSEDEIGRGGSRNSSFRWEKMDPDAAPPCSPLSEDEIWSRADYFLARVVPVAEQAGVRLACHPHDPWTPPGYRGVTRILGTVEGMKQFVGLHDSPFHGLNFCIGTVAENLEDPAREMDDVIRWFGTRGKLHNIHFRNIKGRKLGFTEVFLDEGDVDMIAALRVLKEVGYQYMVMPDHVPAIDARDPEGAAFAFSYGYIAAALQAVGA
ncbi:mannonate dehydratase [Radicibacter daui]|uniref:mannonate dehydratase n=1 Tax=Radicibacter daui TaxID=3064829 RepID=UPI004046F36B